MSKNNSLQNIVFNDKDMEMPNEGKPNVLTAWS
jgi:hypothetical protein